MRIVPSRPGAVQEIGGRNLGAYSQSVCFAAKVGCRLWVREIWRREVRDGWNLGARSVLGVAFLLSDSPWAQARLA